jgi:glycosyltransferase involved in cell wall biosynthesis
VVHGCYRGSRVLSAVSATEVVVTRRRRGLDRVARFVAPSAFMAARLVDIGLPPERLVVKPHFVPDPGPRPRPPSSSDEVLFIGRLAPGKGLLTLLRAWERYRTSTTGRAASLRLTIVGDGPIADDLVEAAPRGVEFTGWLPAPEVRERLAAARAFVFPSEWYEPFGMVLIEAMSAGLPIVASTAADAVAITDPPPELVAAAGDERELASALGRLDDDTLVDRAGTASRRRFESRYDLTAGIAGLEDLYTGTIGGEAGRADRAACGTAAR